MRMDPSAVRVIAAAIALAASGGCATKGDLRNVQLEIRALSERQDSLMSELHQLTLTTQDTLREQSLQLFDFRGEIFRQLRDISESIVRLEALAGESQRGISGVRDQLANLRRGTATQPEQEAAPPSGEEPVATGGDAESIYGAAVGQFNRGSLAAARAAFQQFLQAFPSHRLAPDAHYYLADILVQEDRIEDALDAFLEIPEIFPTAAKVPDAWYRAALIQIELGRTDEARANLQRVINTFPDSGVATVARAKLEEIR